jgi:hypothetical protein
VANLRRSEIAGRRREPRAATKAARASANETEFDRDEVVVCMVLAFAFGNALLTVIYRLMG